MSGLLFLTAEDFVIQKGAKGNIMCHGIPGFSLILFYSTHCTHCQTLIPIFKKLPGTIQGCQFGMINVSTNKKCIQMSKNTVAAISYVPYIVLHVNGRPFMVYKGPYDPNEIRRFVIEVANSIQKKQQFHAKGKQTQQGPHGHKKSIPEYTVGIPIYGDGNENVCYLDFVEAYPGKKR